MTALLLTAREFCAWCQSEPGSELHEGKKALAILSRLYYQALMLEAPTQYDSEINFAAIDRDEWEKVYARSAALPFQYYSSYFDPLIVPPEDHEIGDLSDDIADIYKDLSAAVALFDAGHEAEAQWEFQWSFGVHWGRHASGAIRALHCWYVDSSEF